MAESRIPLQPDDAATASGGAEHTDQVGEARVHTGRSEAKPGEARDIAFAWRVRWPKDKGVVMMPAG